jgi:hypothetical protein
MKTLAAHELADTLAFERREVGKAFAHDPSETLALRRGKRGEAFAEKIPEMLALERAEAAHVALAHAALPGTAFLINS